MSVGQSRGKADIDESSRFVTGQVIDANGGEFMS